MIVGIVCANWYILSTSSKFPFLFSFFVSLRISGTLGRHSSCKVDLNSNWSIKNSTRSCLLLICSISVKGCFNHSFNNLTPAFVLHLFNSWNRLVHFWLDPTLIVAEVFCDPAGKIFNALIAEASNLTNCDKECSTISKFPKLVSSLMILRYCNNTLHAPRAFAENLDTDNDNSFPQSFAKSDSTSFPLKSLALTKDATHEHLSITLKIFFKSFSMVGLSRKSGIRHSLIPN